MRFLLTVKSDESRPAGPPPPAFLQALQAAGERATEDGTLLDVGGLLPSAAGAQVRCTDGQVTVVDGPFTEAKEVVGGYSMWQLRSREEAIEAGRRFMQLHADNWPGYQGTCEVRQIMGAEDMPGSTNHGQ